MSAAYTRAALSNPLVAVRDEHRDRFVLDREPGVEVAAALQRAAEVVLRGRDDGRHAEVLAADERLAQPALRVRVRADLEARVADVSALDVFVAPVAGGRERLGGRVLGFEIRARVAREHRARRATLVNAREQARIGVLPAISSTRSSSACASSE